MKTIQRSILLALALFLVLNACQSDDDLPQNPGPSLPNYIVEESAFGCSNYQMIEVNVGFPISHTLKDQGFLIYGGADSLVVTDAVTHERLISEEIKVNKFVTYKNSVMVCAEGGLYEIDNTPTIIERSDLACRDMLLTSGGELLLSLDVIFDGDMLFKWDETQELQEYSDENNAPCGSNLNELTEAENGDIWALSCTGFVVRFRDRSFLDFFDENTIPGATTGNAADRFLDAYGGEMIFTVKRGPLSYQVLKFRQGEWITLFDISTSDSTLTEQDTEFLEPKIRRTLIKNDKLFVGTNRESCRGIHVFDISKNEPLISKDYYVVKDPGLKGHCIDDISLSSNGDIVVTNLTRYISIIDCN